MVTSPLCDPWNLDFAECQAACGMVISPLCDPWNLDFAEECQVGFLQFICLPAWRSMRTSCQCCSRT
eukprot:NODE_20395_length_800_cov_4.109955.p5 GENE.NODE_20395_length_800_cov_4.109955~~NODE_20395_length_800_cov_4.109955.p5  ORF type:complete len:67 (+),score=11.69 NODE_20395_length_800_cov_4.109955:252-452(+)